MEGKCVDASVSNPLIIQEPLLPIYLPGPLLLYYFIFDRIVCVLVTFYIGQHFRDDQHNDNF